jgi:lipopolysaccharide export system protein LptA
MTKEAKIIALKNRMNVHSVFSLILFLALFTWSNNLFSQKKLVKLVRADVSEFDKSYIDAQRVKGNVQFIYEGTLFYCDSAHIFTNKDFDAFGNIRIIKPGEFNLLGDVMHVDQKSKVATINNNVVLRDNQMTLTSNRLIYNIDSEIASYTGGGKIVSNANQNVLNSKEGSYHTKTEIFYFRNKVVLKNPDYTVNSDTLKYNDRTEVAYFFGPTTIEGDDTFIYCENGWYNTDKDICQFNKNAFVRSEKTELRGDSIYYNGEAGFGEVFKKVTIRDTTANFFISGEYGYHEEKTKKSFVTDKALLTQFFEGGDSLFMHADTLKSVPDSAGKDVLYAFYGVKIFKDDLQGKCDSLVYAVSDSTLRMFNEPVLWSDENQITGDSIRITMANNKVDRMFVRENAFIISETRQGKYNQIKGRKLTADFIDSKINSVYVEGNGQLVYFPVEEKKDSLSTKPPKLIGLNKGDCSNIFIQIKENEIKKLRLEREANSTFSPMKMADSANFLLDGYKWLIDLRPMSKADLFLKPNIELELEKGK